MSLDLEKLRNDNIDFFTVADTMRSDKTPFGVSVFVGIDMEYVLEPLNKNKNRLLSIQLVFASRWGSGHLLILCEGGKRLTTTQIAKRVIAALTIPSGVDTSRISLILIAHNAVAEWSHLADRDAKDVVKHLSYLRKTIVTEHPIKKKIKPGCVAYIYIFDTMLLAPESRKSLDKLSELLGPEANRKIHIPKKYKRRMDLLLQDDPELYRLYSMRDAELCLQLFLAMQRNANLLVFGELQKLFRTLAAPAVIKYLLHHPWYKEYQQALNGPMFSDAMELAKSAFHGGLNDSFFVGRTERYFGKFVYMFFDLDFKNCYPTALSLCSKLNVTQAPDLIPIEFRLTPDGEAALRKDNVSDAVIEKVRTALAASQKAFDDLLIKDARCRRVAKTVRYHCTVIQKRHLLQWRSAWEAARVLPLDHKAHHLIPGFAHVRFKFPEGTKHSCLYKCDPAYGLLYVLEGDGVFTANEILLAEDAGAEIEVLASVTFAVARDDYEQPEFTFRNYMKELIKMRADNDALGTTEGRVSAEILKTFANSVYGKIAQGINYRPMFRPSVGGTAPVDRSALTEPVTAALITGSVRSALCAIFVAVDTYNATRNQEERLLLLSATTDGFILGVPNRNRVSGETFYECTADDLKLKKGDASNAIKVLKEYECGALLDLMNQHVSLIQMQSARYHLTGKTDILEIKQAVDKVICIKTRGQIGEHESGNSPLLAKCGHRVPEADMIDDPDDELPTGIARNNKERDWLVKHLDRREKSNGIN